MPPGAVVVSLAVSGGVAGWLLVVALILAIVLALVGLVMAAMTVFESARAAIDAATEIQSAVSSTDLEVRIGVHTGDSLHRDGDYYGVAVNKAARIAGIAAGGEIVVSAVTAELSGGHGIRLGSPRTVSLKGLAGTHHILTVQPS